MIHLDEAMLDANNPNISIGLTATYRGVSLVMKDNGRPMWRVWLRDEDVARLPGLLEKAMALVVEERGE